MALKPSTLVKVGAVLLLCGGPLVLLSLPGLLRERAAHNESVAIGDLRAVVEAQVAYQARNGEQWEGRVECLAAPAGCLPGYAGAPFLDGAALASPRMGYLREFVAGPAAPRPPGRSATSARGYVFVARPVSPDRHKRAFCVDTTGVVCQAAGDASLAALVEKTSEPEGVRCAASCTALR